MNPNNNKERGGGGGGGREEWLDLGEYYKKEVYFVYDRQNEFLVDKSGLNEVLDGTIRDTSERKSRRVPSGALPDSLRKIERISREYSTKFLVPYHDECKFTEGSGITHFLFARSTAVQSILRIKNITEMLFNPRNQFAVIDCINSNLERSLPTIFRATSKRVVVVDPTAFEPFDAGRVQVLLENLLKLSITDKFVFVFHPRCRELSGPFARDIDRLSGTFVREYPKLAPFVPQPDVPPRDLPLAKRTRLDCGWSCWAVQTAVGLRRREEALEIREMYAVASYAAIGAHEADYFGVRLLSSTNGVSELEHSANGSATFRLDPLVVPSKRHLEIRINQQHGGMLGWNRIRYFMNADKLERFHQVDAERAVVSFKCVGDASGYAGRLLGEASLGVGGATVLEREEQTKKVRFTNIETESFDSFFGQVSGVCKNIVKSVRNEDGSGFGMIEGKFKRIDDAVMTYLMFNDRLIGKTHVRVNFC